MLTLAIAYFLSQKDFLDAEAIITILIFAIVGDVFIAVLVVPAILD